MDNNIEQNLLTQKHSYFGVILSILIIVLIVILGLLYAWSTELMTQRNTPVPTTVSTRPTAEENNEPESTTAEAQTETLGAMSTSDELGAIESDLESTPFEEEAIEASLQNIESELKY